ncbi:MAG: hypothetical protein M9949_04605 [Candidatus Kapabacteria bacterium]|nr:hypothetical protein [Candidatus Kapabacteria bacterium]
MSKESTSMLITGVPCCYLLEVKTGPTIASPSGDADAADRLKFEALSENPVFKFPASSDNEEGEKYEIAIAGDITIEFPKFLKRLAGNETEADTITLKDVTPASQESTGKGEVVINTTEADRDSATWTALISKLKGKVNKYFLGVFPTGFTHSGRNSANKADGWIYFIGKLTGDVENKAPLTLTLGAVKCPFATETGWETQVTGLDFAATPVAEEPGYIKLKGSSTFLLTPTNLVSGDATILADGDVVIKAATYA